MAERPVEIAAPVPVVARAIREARYAARGAAGPLLLTEDRRRAVELLEALHAAGWRIVRTDPACGSAGSTHDYGDPHVAIGSCIVDEWLPS